MNTLAGRIRIYQNVGELVAVDCRHWSAVWTDSCLWSLAARGEVTPEVLKQGKWSKWSSLMLGRRGASGMKQWRCHICRIPSSLEAVRFREALLLE